MRLCVAEPDLVRVNFV